MVIKSVKHWLPVSLASPTPSSTRPCRRRRSAASNRLQRPSSTPHLPSSVVSITLPLFYGELHSKFVHVFSLAFTTPANRYFLHFTDCRYLSLSILAFAILQQRPLRLLIIFSNTTQQTASCRALFNLLECTTTRPAAYTSLFQTGGPFVVVRFDFDVRYPLVALRPGFNSRIANANVHENRCRYS